MSTTGSVKVPPIEAGSSSTVIDRHGDPDLLCSCRHRGEHAEAPSADRRRPARPRDQRRRAWPHRSRRRSRSHLHLDRPRVQPSGCRGLRSPASTVASVTRGVRALPSPAVPRLRVDHALRTAIVATVVARLALIPGLLYRGARSHRAQPAAVQRGGRADAVGLVVVRAHRHPRIRAAAARQAVLAMALLPRVPGDRSRRRGDGRQRLLVRVGDQHWRR